MPLSLSPWRPVALSLAVLATACGGGDDAPATPNPTPEPGVVGPAGGTVTAANGNVRLVVPAGAVPADVRLTATPVADPEPSDKTIGGTVHQFGPSGTQFAVPVTVSLKYAPAQLPAGVQQGELTISKYQNGTWVPLAVPVTVDSAAREVRGALSSFSLYAVTEKDCAARDLALGGTRSGTLDTTDCVFNAQDGRKFDVFRFSVPTRQIVEMTTTSAVPGAQGIFFPGSRNAWAAQARGAQPDVTQRWLLEPGIYEAYVRGDNAQSVGAYTVAARSFATSFPAPPQGCSNILMREGTVQGRAETNDCAITTIYAANPAQRQEQTWGEYHVFRPTSSTSYTITVQSQGGGGYVALYVPAVQEAPLTIRTFAAGGTTTWSFTTPNPGDAFHYFEVAPTPHPSDRTQLAPLNYTLTITKNN
jgi:hypothetical protein